MNDELAPVINDSIAIVGMVGRFPGASNVDQLWRNLCEGIESTTFFTDAQLDPSIDPDLLQDASYVKARGVIEGGETFDAAFFGITPREAEVMDPQARVFLELVYEALENAGYVADTFDGLIGLYAGCGQNTYFANHICGRSEIVNRLGEFQTMLANEKDFLTTRAAYKLDLKGPSVTISTACSTSLVAVSEAFESLNNYHCDLAIAGGISITTPQNSGYVSQEGGMLSGDGHCRSFDVNGQGTMFNNGAGLVVLRRLDDALAASDRIYAVIKGVGVNNDGADKVSFTAPSVDGQAQAISMAQAYADFHPETISYIEAHGTATPLGDPIEIEALTQAFRLRTNANQFCAIGSIKSNFGHTVAAAGVAGLIKTALSLYHQQIPASLNFTTPNPNLDLENSPFYVNTQLTPWPEGETPRRAGVSSFGVGGTNAHVVLEEAPLAQPTASYRPQQLLLLSAKTSTALDAASQNLARYLETHPDINLADVAYTLDRGRKAFSYRRCIVGSNPVDIALALQTGDARRVLTRHHNEVQQPNVVFMFPGQGSQYVNMGGTFYRDEPVFRDVVDRCAEILTPVLGRDIRDVMYPADGDQDTAEVSLKQTLYTQPALFVTEYALAQLWIAWGIIPQATIGHSIGEFVSACLAGVFSLADALRLVATRGRLMWDLPGGAMLSVRLAAAEVAPRLTADLAIAAINGPSLCVVSGPIGSIEHLERQLAAEEIACRQLQTSHAFHSPMMDPIVAPFAEIVAQVELSPPQMPFISTVSGTWITDEQATDPNYWASHLRQTVRFAAGIQTLWQQAWVLLEVGPRQTAATLARQQAQDLNRQIAISSLSDRADDGAEWTALLQAIGQLWLAGKSILPALDNDNSTQSAPQAVRHRIPLPTYPFERQRFWIDPLPHPHRQRSSHLVAQTAALTHSLPQTEPAMSDRDLALIPLLKAVIEETSGLEMTGVNAATTFLEMGLDSLSLTQVGLALKKKFKVKVTLRQLLEVYPNFGTLAEFMTQTVAPELLPVAVTPAVVHPPAVNAPIIAPVVSVSAPAVDRNGSRPPVSLPSIATSGLESVFNQQLQIMAQQLALLGNHSPDSSTANIQPPTLPAIAENSPPPVAESEPGGEQISLDPGLLQSRIKLLDVDKSQTKTLTSAQHQCLDKIIQTYTQKTLKSKEFAQSHRAHLADPRTAAGFNPVMKEMVYPIVIARSSGAKLWDLDDNEYVDLSNGFGLNLFGWSPPFINDAIAAQLKLGMEIGPQTPLVGEVAQLMCELTNFDRAAFCNTGSEAVMAALRMARTITGRNLIVIFAGAYHGMHDEVIVRGSKKLRSIPAAPGIPPEMVENLLVIDYDAPNILEILNSRADELAGVMVESVQSRRPEFQPQQLLQQLREFTTRVEIPLIFDEVVTGFRIHPGGAQAHFGIKADIATYGKIVGGGLPIGVVAGTSQYLDALDGGWWQFGDDSIPEVGVTYFAGTFVRHPLAMAAAKAVLTHLKQSGPSLQQNLNAKTDRFVAELVEYLHQMQAPVTVHNFGSLFMVKYTPDFAYGDLLFYLLRSNGVHIWDGRPCFLTTAHTDADLALVISAFKATITELQAGGFLTTPSIAITHSQPSASSVPNSNGKIHNPPPQANAKLGRDPQGNPAWYVPDPKRPGKYLQIAGSFAQ
jgi:acyl transferase domain-containing protein/glutamate-1-semialdehyde aminotransferase